MRTIEQELYSTMGPKSSIAWQGGKIYWGQIIVGRYDFKGNIVIDWTKFPSDLSCRFPLLEFEKTVLDILLEIFSSPSTSVSILDMNQFIELLILVFKEVRAIEVKSSRYKVKKGHYRFLFQLDNLSIPVEVFRTSAGIFRLGHNEHSFEITALDKLYDAVSTITKTLRIPIEKSLPFSD